MAKAEHSKKFENVKYWYDKEIWDIRRVYNAVGRWITPEEYEEITGEVYDG